MDEYLPSALAIGVEYDTFWRLTPRLLKSFAKAHLIKTRDAELFAYLSGRYVFDAVSIALSNAFAKKGSTPIKWMTEPYRVLPLTPEEEAQREEEERNKAIAFFESLAKSFGENENSVEGG